MRIFLSSPVKKKQYLLIAGDSIIVFFAILLSYVLRVRVIEGQSIYLVKDRLTWLILPVILIHILFYYIFDLYNLDKKFRGLSYFLNVCFSVILAVSLIAVVFYFWPEYRFGRVVLTLQIFILIFALYLWRFVFIHTIQKEIGKKNILFLTDYEESKFLIDEIRRYPVKEFNLIGFLSNDEALIGKTISGLAVFNATEDIEQVILNNEIDVVVISTQSMPSKDLAEIALKMKFKGIKIYDSAQIYKNLTGKVPVFHINDQWFFSSSIIEYSRYSPYTKVKRLYDVSLSLVILLITFPLLVLCALLIKIDSKGPVFFKQERLGLDQKPFNLIKLRTMIKNAEEKTGPKWAEPKDPRITKVGKFLRKIGLDEIPQLINVVKGEMSFVGPRPIRKIFEDQFSLKVPYYYLRHTIKPGVTGWAQVRHENPRSDTGPVERLQYDLFYIQEASLLLDFMIFLKTIQYILFRYSK